MGIPLSADVESETERVVFGKTKVICTSFIYEDESAGRSSVPGIRRNDVESGLQLCFELGCRNTKSEHFVSPSLDIYTPMLERHAIGVKGSSITLKYTDVLRREVQDLLELFVSVPDQGFRLALLADVRNGSHELEVAGVIPRRASAYIADDSL
jgi:hypothetical protein